MGKYPDEPNVRARHRPGAPKAADPRVEMSACESDSSYYARDWMSQITQILHSLSGEDGRHRAEELLPLVYDELRKLAAGKLSREAPGQTLQATALVHEAWLRIGADDYQPWQGRRHFFAAAAEAMRRILIEQARRKKAVRHGGGQQRVDLEAVEIAASNSDDHPMMRWTSWPATTRPKPKL